MKKRICPQCNEVTSAANYTCPNCSASLAKAEVIEVDDTLHTLRVKESEPFISGGHCTKCGARVKAGASTCLNCGESLRQRTTFDSSETYSNNTFLLVMSLLISPVGIIAGVIFLTSDDEEKKSNGKKCMLLGLLWPTILLVICVFNLMV